MSDRPKLTRGDRAYRREKLIAAYMRGGCSRSVASLFGLTSGYVRSVVRDAGVARKVGKPRAASL